MAMGWKDWKSILCWSAYIERVRRRITEEWFCGRGTDRSARTSSFGTRPRAGKEKTVGENGGIVFFLFGEHGIVVKPVGVVRRWMRCVQNNGRRKRIGRLAHIYMIIYHYYCANHWIVNN